MGCADRVDSPLAVRSGVGRSGGGAVAGLERNGATGLGAGKAHSLYRSGNPGGGDHRHSRVPGRHPTLPS